MGFLCAVIIIRSTEYLLHLISMIKFPGYSKTVRNDTGDVISKTGVSMEMLEWLGHKINLMYA